jgi:2-polyprenyl-6-methoxyphenol hydroxylase-like FAD-dependent oxidoreductase
MTRALIVGGGIAGAATAMALRKAGLDPVVYEAYPTGADDAGAFLTIMGNGLDALRAVDAEDIVVANSFPARSIEAVSAKEGVLGVRELDGPRTLKRAGLYRVLQDELGRRGIPVVHGKRFVGATTGDGVVATFADGTTAEGDLLVGADGIHSVVRSIIDPDAPAPRYTGLNIVYGYARDTVTAPDAYRMIYGTRAFFGYTTAPDGETWWFARLPGDPLDTVTPEDLKKRAIEAFEGDDIPAAEIIAATGDEIIGGNGYDMPTTPHWHARSMVLVGDAAHAASPAAGQGASMALEDSVTLAKCLRDLPDVSRAFTTYEQLRRPRVEGLVAASAAQGNTTDAARTGPSQWVREHHIDWDSPITP